MMMRLPRFLPSVVIACCSVAVPVLTAPVVLAQGEPATSAVTLELKDAVDNFWHNAKTFRYDLAAAAGKKVLEAQADPRELLHAFEAVAEERKDNLDQWMLRWQQVPELRAVVEQLLASINEGHRQRRADQSIIEANVQRLNRSEQAYAFAIQRLRESGELAVPVMLDYLRDPGQSQHHAIIRRALVDMGRDALSPLVAATEMPINERNQAALISVIAALGEIGYDVSVAPLTRLATGQQSPAVVKTAAREALSRMGAAAALEGSVAGLYYEIAQKYYYGKTAVSADGTQPTSFYWLWDDAKGLVKLDVPSAIYNDLMAMKNARQSLQHDANRQDSLSLWLAANYGREARLPAEAKDPTRQASEADAHYYGVTAGAKSLNQVLSRALGDRDTQVALRAIRSLQRIGGQSNVFAAGESSTLVLAMQYPDRVVRFEAALAAADALPQSTFEGQERVVPILAEALAQTGKPYVMVITSEAQLNAQVQQLNSAGYIAAGSSDPQAAATSALPAIDVILITDEDAGKVEAIRQLAASTPRLQGAALLIVTKTAASPFVVHAVSNPLISVTQAQKIEDLKPAIEAARKKAGSLPMDEKVATDFALRAARSLSQLALARGQILDLSAAQTTLLQALQDSRPQVVRASGEALALMNAPAAQSALLAGALDAGTSTELKMSLYGSLATSARFFGNLLGSGEVAQLQKAVANEADAGVRSSAAEAHGALNLPADQVKRLLLNAGR